MNAEQTALVQRFDGFLQKIDDRLTELMTEAEAGLGAQFAEHPEDALAFGNAVSGLDHQIQQLREKVNQTWEAQIEPAYSRLDQGGGAFLDRGHDRKEDFLLAFSERWETFKAQAQVAFFENMRPRAEAASGKELRCTGCGGVVEPPSRRESISLRCPYCQAVNQIIPDAVVTTYYGGAAHAAGEAEALPLRFACERHQIEINRDRRRRSWGQETIEQLQKWEQLERRYWTTFAQAQGRFLGQPPDQAFVDSRMEAFYRYHLDNNQVWRKAMGR